MINISTNEVVIARYAGGLYDVALDFNTANAVDAAIAASSPATGVNDFLNQIYVRDFGTVATDVVAATIARNIGLTPPLSDYAATYITGLLNAAAPEARGAVVADALNLFATLTDNADPAWAAAATAWEHQVTAAVAYSNTAANTVLAPLPLPVLDGKAFTLTPQVAGGADVMRLTGDQDVRIDFTDPANQIKGLDLNGNGVIANDGVENKITGKAANFEIVDAYARNPLNQFDISQNFLGDIRYDGTGFAGDGVSTNGNIVLGGLGGDTIFGGIGNDFLTGGGVAATNAGVDSLSGGRNADFFFAEMSALDPTDGERLFIDGGITADDNAAGTTQSAQDADWLLFEASDDDEPVNINLRDDSLLDPGELVVDQPGNIVSRSGQAVGTLRDIENFDASGSLYGFLDNIPVELGGRAVDGRVVPNGTLNNGIGSSAQLFVSGSNVANIIVGGYDNDRIEGNDGNDLLMGGNLNNLINPNLLTIVNDGRDELIGGLGNDDIVFEADGGRIEGDATIDVIGAGNDTLWLTNRALGTGTVAGMTTDNVLRFDLDAQNIDTAAGYGGADVGSRDGVANDTQDQTNYNAGIARTTVQDMDNVIATGLGAVDYDTDGSNTGNLGHLSQVNLAGYQGDLTLRGTAAGNVLYANTGKDVLEGRAGNDRLSGGEGDDDFVFFLQDAAGDGVDVIHRQADANNDNLWDGYSAATRVGTFAKDFGVNATTVLGASALTIDFGTTDLASPDVSIARFSIVIGGITFAVTDPAAQAQLLAAVSVAEVAAIAQTAFNAQDPNVTVTASGSRVIVTDATPSGGRDISDTVSEGYQLAFAVSNGQAEARASFGPAAASVTQDRLIYRAYEDRADGESVDDDAITGSTISLGSDAYAEDLVVNFAADGTRLAEDQAYTVTFQNLTTQDKVTVAVNGVTYVLQVGVDLDGNSIAAEDGVGDAQPAIQAAFVTRLNAFINSFMDNDTAAGQVASATNGVDTLVLTQVAYNGEETVFMTTPVVTLQNLSNGEVPSVTVTNNAQHEVLLFNYDGRNLAGTGKNLDGSNVLFVGDTNVNQALLQTANNLTGGTITGTDADLVDGGPDDLAGVTNNTATNANLAVNFSVHGDDFILGAAADDTINAGTGDDRVQGSLGTDTLDGGKNYYAVRVLGEAEARVLKWNVWEAANPTSAQSLLADPTLAGKVISNITLINQSEDGTGTVSGLFDDTLIYAQADFNTGATKFTVTLDDFTVDGGVVNLRNGGAGHVTVDLTGTGSTLSTSKFTNFENVRTVSGTGLAVAGAGGGQGNDTLDVAALSTATAGISYDLTNAAGAGEVRYSANPHASLTRPVAADFEALVLKVDGVESVVTGTGDDLLLIDETEAAKDNAFSAGLGDDRIEYQNVFDAAPATDAVAQPTVTIKVNTAADQDKVEMTSGRVGTVVATDTLNGVEYITLAGNTATSARESDVLDVRAMTSGATVSYVDGTVKDLAGLTQVTIEGIAQMENVWADGNDTVIVASSAAMGGANTREDVTDGTPASDITLPSFLDFDEISSTTVGGVTTVKRVPFVNQTSAQIQDVVNNGQYTFNLSKSGTASDTDTVDYSFAVNSISAVVELDPAKPNQYVLVDGDAVYAFDGASRVDDNDRIDVLTSVEKIVASQGESVLDLTSSTKGLEVEFGAYDPNNYVPAFDRDVYNVQISDLASSVPLTRSYVEYREAGKIANSVAIPAVETATWNRIEGSDFAEKVVLNSAHSFDADTFNLRGGANEVKYNELTRSINLVLSATDFVAANPLTTGLINGVATFQDGDGNPLPGGNTHLISSYTADNGIAAGSLRVAASQDAEDTLLFSGLDQKAFILRETGTTDNQITVKLGSGTAPNSIVLTGFELLQDSASSDTYDFGSLTGGIFGLTLLDNVLPDHDAILVANDAVGFNGAAANTISLSALNAPSAAIGALGFDFDVLDVTKVTTSGLTLMGVAGGEGTDEVVVGALSKYVAINDFEALVMTQAAVAAGATTFNLNTTTNSITQGSTTVSYNGNALSFGGLVLEDELGNSYVPAATSAVTVTVTGAEGATVVGGSGADQITGAGGDDTLKGGKGNDVLDGGTAAELVQFNLAGNLSPTAELVLDFMNGGTAHTLFTEGVDFIAGAGNDAVGTAIANRLNGNLVATNAAFDADPNSNITSVAYNTTSDQLLFTFAPGYNVATTPSFNIDVADSTNATPISAPTVLTQGGDGGRNTFLFEGKAADNGVDTINNFKAAGAASDDFLNYTAFLGAVTRNTTAANFTAGLDLTGAANVGVVFNKASLLAAADISATVAAGKIAVENNSKAVVYVTADLDGVADTTNQPYDVYYIEDTDTTAAQSYAVTKVATLNSLSELNASVLAGGAAPVVPTLTLTASAASVNEGAPLPTSVTFNLDTTNVAAGTVFNYELGGVGIDVADTTVPLTGTLTVGAGGAASLVVTPTADLTTEGNETLTMTVTGAGKAATSSVLINDTSTSVTPPRVRVDLSSGAITADNAKQEDFVYNFKMVGGRATKAGDGEVGITGFDVVNDKLVFEDIAGTGTVLTEAEFLALPGVVVSESPFAPIETTFYFDPDAGVLGGVTLVGIQDAALATIVVETFLA